MRDKKIKEILGMELKPGDKIKLLSMPDDPDPIPVGSTAIVRNIVLFGDEVQVQVNWINLDRSLNLICPPDKFVKI